MFAIHETFSAASFDPRLSWLNPPSAFQLGVDGLVIEPSAGSDFWQRTHYGFTPDSGHGLLAEVNFDFRLETSVSFLPRHQYDQAGLLVRISKRCWLKTSIEFEGHEPSRLGSVVTNDAWSDWATQDVPAETRSARFRISRTAGDYLVEYAADDAFWSQIRIAHLHEDDGTCAIHAGIYACSPKGSGFQATFRELRLEQL